MRGRRKIEAVTKPFARNNRRRDLVYLIVRYRLGRIGLTLATLLSMSAQVAAGPVDMWARVNALRYFPLIWVNLADSVRESWYGAGQDLTPKEAVLSRVYDMPRAGARELGVIVGRRVLVKDRWDGHPTVGVELVCRMHGETERPRWLVIDDWEHGANALGMEFRSRRDRFHEWVKLPPVACGTPVWWPTQSTDLRGYSVESYDRLYQIDAVRGEIAYTGKPVRLDPKAAYKILRIHDGVIELRRAIELDFTGELDPISTPPEMLRADAEYRASLLREEPLPPTIRVKISDVVDDDGRLRLGLDTADRC